MSGIIDTIEDNLKDAIEDLGENLLNLDINNDGQIGSEPEENDDNPEEEELQEEEPDENDDEDVEEPWITEEGVEKVYDDEEVSESEDDEDDEEEDDEISETEQEDHFEKFNEHMRKNHIVDFHPESLIHNYEEVKMMAMVKRNDKGIIIDELHKTIPILTKYEKTRIIGQRAKQINAGAIPFIKPTKDMMTGYLIAKKEVEEKKTPFIIRRPLPNGGSEYWHLRDLEILY